MGDLCLPPESWLPRRDLPKAKYIFCATTIHQPQKVERDHKVKKRVGPSSIPSCQLLAMSTEPGERKENECQRNACRTKKQIEDGNSGLKLIFPTFICSILISLFGKPSKTCYLSPTSDPSFKLIQQQQQFYFFKLSNTVSEANEGSHLVATR